MQVKGLREEQENCIKIWSMEDVFAILPNVFGKPQTGGHVTFTRWCSFASQRRAFVYFFARCSSRCVHQLTERLEEASSQYTYVILFTFITAKLRENRGDPKWQHLQTRRGRHNERGTMVNGKAMIINRLFAWIALLTIITTLMAVLLYVLRFRKGEK